MSYIRFNSINGESEVRGSERAHMGCFISDMSLGIMSLDNFFSGIEIYKPILNPEHYLYEMRNHGDKELAYSLGTAIRVGLESKSPFILNGEEVDTWHLQLNTSLTLVDILPTNKFGGFFSLER